VTWQFGRRAVGLADSYAGDVDLQAIAKLLGAIRTPFAEMDGLEFDVLYDATVVSTTNCVPATRCCARRTRGPIRRADDSSGTTISPSRLLERITAVHITALRAYEQMTEQDLGALAPHLAVAQLFPAVLRGRLKVRGPSHYPEPTLTTWFEPAPFGPDQNAVDFRIDDARFTRAEFEETWVVVKSRRPRVSTWGFQEGG